MNEFNLAEESKPVQEAKVCVSVVLLDHSSLASERASQPSQLADFTLPPSHHGRVSSEMRVSVVGACTHHSPAFQSRLD